MEKIKQQIEKTFRKINGRTPKLTQKIEMEIRE
jgi:hypothetical protein